MIRNNLLTKQLNRGGARMDPDIKTLWVEALRSGNYPKGREYLKKGGKFCCLGVLCEVAGLEQETWADGEVKFATAHDWSSTDLPQDFADEVGIDDYWCDYLMGENDYLATFGELADVIEEYL